MYLEELSLTSNQICDEGVKLITNLDCKWLNSLDLGYNPIGNKAVKYICSTEWRVLKYLML